MTEPSCNARLVIIGRHSKVWMALSRCSQFADITVCAIGHAELRRFVFLPGDRVWVLSYSRSHHQNRALLEILAKYNFIDVNYVSSASTNVTGLTECYSYPVVKKQAEEDAVRLCEARIVRIGLFFSEPEELPAGRTIVTSVSELAEFMRFIQKSDNKDVNLFHMVEKPFPSMIEHVLYRCYGKLLSATGRFPCLLRPLDMLLRSLNMRWYGYLYLSNRLWSTMI